MDIFYDLFFGCSRNESRSSKDNVNIASQQRFFAKKIQEKTLTVGCVNRVMISSLQKQLAPYIERGDYIELDGKQCRHLAHLQQLNALVKNRVAKKRSAKGFCFDKIVLEVFESRPTLLQIFQKAESFELKFLELAQKTDHFIKVVNFRLNRYRVIVEVRRKWLLTLNPLRNFKRVFVSFYGNGELKMVYEDPKP